MRLRTMVAVLSMAGMLAGPVSAQQTPFSIDDVIAAPFAENLTSGGATIAWVHNTRGVRNVWVATGPQFTGRQLTRYTADDGQAIGNVVVSPDGKTVFYVRGGGPNRQGEIPNPTSDPRGQEQAVWRIAVAGGEPVRVGVGSGVAMSPTGDRVVYVSRGQVWTAQVGGTSPAAAELFKARGGAGTLRFSPDGSKLAFTSGRGTHSFIGVYDFSARSLRWIEPSYDRDGHAAWSPDGKRLAFVRIPAGIRMPLFGAIRSARPWSIWVADVGAGTARKIWTAAEGDGSVFQGPTGPGLMWGAGDRLVFLWERNDWGQLYSIPAQGGEPVHLTPGAGEVEYVTLSPDGQSVYYNTNIGNIDRRDLYRVSVNGGAPEPLWRSEKSIEWAPEPLADGRTLAFLHSDARTPSHAAVLIDGKIRPLAPGSTPASFPSSRLVEPEQVIYTSADGMQIHAQLFLPPDLKPGEKRPAVVFFHGGSRRQMLLGFHYMGYYAGAYAMNQWLAQHGYVVLSANYRSGTGYGMKFREAENYGATGATEFNDVMGAGMYLRGRADVDGNRIGLWGGSYGGYLTAMGLAKASDLYKAGVDIHGVHDWNEGIHNFVPSYNPLEDPRATQLAFDSSPLRWVDTWRSPVLIIHGDDDRNVKFNESIRLVAALRNQGIEPETMVFPDDVHDFLTYDNWSRIYRASLDFFNRHLKR